MDTDLPQESAEELFENAPCGYFSTLPDGTLIRVNHTFLQWTGYEREALLAGRRWQELLTVPSKIYYETHFAPLLRMQGVVNEIACDLVRPERAPLPVLLNAVQVEDVTGQPLLLRFTVFDATDRRRYERELLEARRRSEHYAVIVRASANSILSLTPDGTVQTWNPAAEHLFGYTAAEAVGRTIQELIKLDAFDTPAHSVLTELKSGQALQLETVGVRKDGRPVDVSLSLTPLLEPPGELTGISVILRDITERKRRERNLAFLAEIMADFAPLKTTDEILPLACAKIAAHLNLSRCVFVEINEAEDEAKIIYDGGTDAVPSLVGVYKIAEFLTQDEQRELAAGRAIVINDVSTAPRDAEAAKRFAQLRIGALVNVPSISDDGRWSFVLSAMQSEPCLWRADEIELLQDLSARLWLRLERARAEDSLRAAHDTFRHLVENSPFGVYTVDADFRLAQVSAGAQPVFENVRPLIGRDFAEVLRIIWPEPFASEAIDLFRNTLETGEPYHSPNTVERRKDIGEVGSFDWKIERVTLPDGRYGVVCHFYDLSERQHYEAALRESEERLRLATEAAEMFSWESDLQQRTIKWSENAARLLECAPEELPVELEHSQFFAAPAEIARLRQEFAEFLRQGVSHYTQEFRGRDEDDQTKYWRAHGLILYDAGGTPLQVVGITQNITKRKQAKVTERLLAEMRERNHLAQELHDTVAQALGYLNLKMGIAQTMLDSHDIEAAKAQLQELKGVIGEAYTDVREEIFNLKAKLRSNMSFMEMLQRYIDKYQRFYNLEIRLVEETDPSLFQFSPEVTGQLVRVIQESLINIRKHAHVNTATIRLGRTNGTLCISIEDMGQGFDLAQSRDKSSSFGLQIMHERIESIGGSLEIESVPGQGTRVVLYYKKR